jgi:hypothetical protein
MHREKKTNMHRLLNCVGLICLLALPAAAAGPDFPFWSGQIPSTQTSAASTEKTTSSTPAATKSVDLPPAQSSRRREPDWLKRMDKNDRATLTGGWGLQNLSGGTSLTTAGDRAGQYAPNTYQGAQFQRWNNVAVRQEIPGWNSLTPAFPPALWSQGPLGPNSYFGPDAQRWGNMSAGTVAPNPVSGGWLWR